jgi:integrase
MSAASKAVAQREANALDIKRAKATDKPIRLRCGKGLFCTVTPAGTKTFKTDYWRGGRHFEVVLGHYPEMSLADATAARMKLRRTVRAGGNPRVEIEAARAERIEADAATVRLIGERWIAVASAHWSPDYRRNVAYRLAKYVYKAIGNDPVARVSTMDIETLLHGIADGKRTQAAHVRQHMQCLFDYAIGHDLMAANPVRKLKYLPKRVLNNEHEQTQPHVETIEAARAVLHAVEASTVNPFLKLVHRLIALTVVRKMEGMGAQWSEFADGADGMTWTIPAARMKGRRGLKRAHVIPLSPQAADVIHAARRLALLLGIRSDSVFPGRGEGGNLDRSSLNFAMSSVGLVGVHSVHGWRTVFSTLLNEADPGAYRVIDVMLAHRAFGAVEAHYNKAQFLTERRRMATLWADQLLQGAPSAMGLIGEPGERASNVLYLSEAA